jgi:hypothetical protein
VGLSTLSHLRNRRRYWYWGYSAVSGIETSLY